MFVAHLVLSIFSAFSVYIVHCIDLSSFVVENVASFSKIDFKTSNMIEINALELYIAPCHSAQLRSAHNSLIRISASETAHNLFYVNNIQFRWAAVCNKAQIFNTLTAVFYRPFSFQYGSFSISIERVRCQHKLATDEANGRRNRENERTSDRVMRAHTQQD